MFGSTTHVLPSIVKSKLTFYNIIVISAEVLTFGKYFGIKQQQHYQHAPSILDMTVLQLLGLALYLLEGICYANWIFYESVWWNLVIQNSATNEALELKKSTWYNYC